MIARTANTYLSVTASVAEWCRETDRLVANPFTGIGNVDERADRGLTVDVHAMRTTFGTPLSRGGVSLRTAQAAMRHSKPELTANVYTDPRLLDVAGALAALPLLPLSGNDRRERARVTGTTGAPTDSVRTLGQKLGHPANKPVRSVTEADKTAGPAEDCPAAAEVAQPLR
ncbi:MAG TPA: hypothetical protein VF796_17725 [Humisphaera sp.]